MVAIQAFQILMSCLLLLFVPQQCDGDTSLPNNDPNYFPHTCSLTESVEHVSSAQAFGIALNFICLALMLCRQFYTWKREQWMLEYFDDDDCFTDENLGKTLSKYPEVNDDFQRFNRVVIGTSLACMILCLINVIASGYLIFKFHFAGTRTVTTYLSYVLSLFGMFKGNVQYAYAGISKGKGYSLIEIEPFEWNMVAAKYAAQGQHEKPQV